MSLLYLIFLSCINISLISNTIYKILEMILNPVESFQNESFFYSCFKKFGFVQNPFLIVPTLNKINIKKKAKFILAFDFNTFCSTIPHKLLIKELSEVINFIFKLKFKKHIGFFKTSVYWTSKGVGRRYFTKQTLFNAKSILINKCFFTISNLTKY